MDNYKSDYDLAHSSHVTDHDIGEESLESLLRLSIEREEEMMRTYLITAERIHGNPDLKERLTNFAEGNAKRSRQLLNELRQ